MSGERMIRVRFAPSPTGHLHVGNARTALFNWLYARRHGGTFVLRLEDTDVERSTLDSAAEILDDLRWLGLLWDEGPEVGGAYGPYRQSERRDLYRSYANELLASRRAYYCFCTAEQLENERQAALAEGRTPRYSGACRSVDPDLAARRVAQGEAAAVRFRVPRGDSEIKFDDLIRGEVVFRTEVIGDPVLLRSDGRPAYNFAVVIDDALMKITDVIRGEDHVSNTPRQLLIYRALGFDPPRFAHLSMVLGSDHARLSKRHGATSVAEFRAHGYLPDALANHLALLGWSPDDGSELLTREALTKRFDLAGVGHSNAVFDVEKLNWVNRHYIKEGDPGRIADASLPYLRDAGFVRGPLSSAASAWLAVVVDLVRAGVDHLDQVPARVRFVFEHDAAKVLAALGPEAETPSVRAMTAALRDDLAGSPRLKPGGFRDLADRLKGRTGKKGKELFHPIRLALLGEPSGPELERALPAIDQGAALSANSGIAPVAGLRERAAAVTAALGL